jgi:DNA-binding transcriptional regulator YiaG
MTARQIIEALGGTTAVAKALGAPVSTVNSWERFNQIPSWRQPKLLELAVGSGVVLTTTDFPPPEDRVAA